MMNEKSPHFESILDNPDNSQPKSPEKSKENAKLTKTQIEMVLNNLNLVKVIAGLECSRLPSHINFDDLYSAGVMGLIKAVQNYDVTKNTSLPTYAQHRIKGAMMDYLREVDWASRDTRRSIKKIEAAAIDLQGKLNKYPSLEELAEKLGMSVENILSILHQLSLKKFSANSRGTEQNLPAPEFPTASHEIPDNIFYKRELKSILDEALKQLKPRYQEILKMYYKEQLTMKEIGKKMGTNESGISQIHKTALKQLHAILKEKGINSSDY